MVNVMTNKEKIERYEKISFITPFSEKNDKLVPVTSIYASPTAKTIDLKFYVGLVGLKPDHSYQFKVFIKPIDISVKVGETRGFINPLTEAFSVTITTKNYEKKYIEGGFNVDMENVELTACGLYQADSILYDVDEVNNCEIEIHSSSTFFIINNERDE